MARKAKMEALKRNRLAVEKLGPKRKALRETWKNINLTEEEREAAYKKLRNMPRISAENRIRNRCELTGRPRAYYRKFRLCRIKFRELALKGLLPGVTKSSW